jgi:chaperonin GroEL (HSP60 family)
VRKILGAGANVVFTTKGIDDLCLKEFIEAGAMAVRRCRKEDLKRIAKATGAQLLSTLANLEGEETFEAAYLGSAEEVVQERISDDELILVKGTKIVSSSSIILRGANDYMLDEMERALHDSLSIIKRTLESGSVVPGGGAVETALNVYLEGFAKSLVRNFGPHWLIPYSDGDTSGFACGHLHHMIHDAPAFRLTNFAIHSNYALKFCAVAPCWCVPFIHKYQQASREQLAIAEFADALLVIPKTLAVNAAKDSTELVGTLRAAHGAAQSAPKDDGKKKYMRYGLDLLNGQIRDNVAAGVLEPTMSKVKSLKSAFEAAVSLLRIDDAIACAPGE